MTGGAVSKELTSTALELAGLAVVVAGVALFAVWLAFVVAGVALAAIGVAVDPPRATRRPPG